VQDYVKQQTDVKRVMLPIFDKLSRREHLTKSEAELGARILFDGLTQGSSNVCELLIGFFGALTIKDATLDELAGMATAMEATKQFTFHFNVDKPLVTAGGTGGDTVPTINVTTPAVIAAAAAGSYALKSGARAFSSRTGSSNLAECLGINVNASREIVQQCVEKIHTTVWASEGVYPWMSPLIELGRKESVSAAMPLLYSLRLMIATALNPFSIKRQVRGVSKPFTERVASVLQQCGYERALVVTGQGKTEAVSIDEFSTLGKSIVSELKLNGTIETYTVSPEELGIKTGKIEDVTARLSHIENSVVALRVLSSSDKSTRRDLILLNAASIIYAADQTENLRDAYELVCQSVDEGKALTKLKELIMLSGGRMENLKNVEESLKGRSM